MHGGVDRLLVWALSEEDKSTTEDEAIFLAAVALSWFLTTPNRFLRDKATKALVQLLTARIQILRRVIVFFKDVDDFYVLERIYAVAYGSAMRSQDHEDLAHLATDVYTQIFHKNNPQPHILLRDYARGIINVALNRGLNLDIEQEKITPPYQSEWPQNIPTESELEKYSDVSEDDPPEKWAMASIYWSTLREGDFARYVIGSHFPWSNYLLGQNHPPSPREQYDAFIQSLTDRQRAAWDNFQIKRIILPPIIVRGEVEDDTQTTIERSKSEILEAGETFRKTLRGKKREVYDNIITPYLASNAYDDDNRIDASSIGRWIFQNVLDLGWTVKRFGEFDRNLTRYSNTGREGHKAERIGKKYQWIGYHEILARASDNFEYLGEFHSDDDEQYEGTWQLNIRNIDPSCLLPDRERISFTPHIISWVAPSQYDRWDEEPNIHEWIVNLNERPDIESLLKVRSPANNNDWYVLESHYLWEPPVPFGEDPHAITRRQIWYHLRSYLVRKDEMKAVFQWAGQQHFWGGWMPDSHSLDDIFLGEFCWAPAFKYHNRAYYGREGWTNLKGKIPGHIHLTTEIYSHGMGEYDCSVDDGYSFYLPCAHIVKQMEVDWFGPSGHVVDGYFFNQSGKIIAYDPSIKNPNHNGCLLIERAAFDQFLEDQGYGLLWIIIGEKRVLSPGAPSEHSLEISGAYQVINGKIVGDVKSKLYPDISDEEARKAFE